MLTGKCPPNSNSIFFVKMKTKKWNCSVFENLNKKQKKKQHEPLLIPASSLRSRLRCCGGRQPAARGEPGGPAGPSGVPPSPGTGSPGLGRAGSAGEQEPGRPRVPGALRAPAGRARTRRAFRFLKIQSKTKKKEITTWQCHFVRIPRRGWNALGVALPGERLPTCPGTGGSAEGAAGGRRAHPVSQAELLPGI